MKAFACIALLLLGAAAPILAAGKPKPLPVCTAHFYLQTGIVGQTTQNQPRVLGLLPVPPSGVTGTPAYMLHPLYGQLSMGPSAHPTLFNVVLDYPQSQPPVMLITRSSNLASVKPVVWHTEKVKGFQGKIGLRYSVVVSLAVHYSSGTARLPLLITLPSTDPSNLNAAAEKDAIVYMPDYMRKGELTLGGKTYTAMLYDEYCRGDFETPANPLFSGTWLLIDVNHNGIIDPRGETYDAHKPFNIGGVTYRLRVLGPSGRKVEVLPSAVSVPQILPPPILTPGHLAPAFTATDMAGKTVQFPQDYRGRYVLLYFWGSWCGDCSQQNPYMVQAWKQYHSKGLDVLGISIDYANSASQVTADMQKLGMQWPNIYDGKLWQAQLAQLYFIRLIPTPLLVDGTTGRIVAARDELLHQNLAATLQRILKNKP